jgi:hypothetical protein
LTTPNHATKLSGTGKLFRQGKEISTVLYTLVSDPRHSHRIISGLFKVIKGHTNLLGSGPLTLFLDNGKQVQFGVSVGNLRSFEFIMDMNNPSTVPSA